MHENKKKTSFETKKWTGRIKVWKIKSILLKK